MQEIGSEDGEGESQGRLVDLHMNGTTAVP